MNGSSSKGFRTFILKDKKKKDVHKGQKGSPDYGFLGCDSV
jgi:hypothetical protein